MSKIKAAAQRPAGGLPGERKQLGSGTPAEP